MILLILSAFSQSMSAILLILIGIIIGMAINQAIHNHNKRQAERGNALVDHYLGTEGWYIMMVSAEDTERRLRILNFLNKNNVEEQDIRITFEGIYYYNTEEIKISGI